MIVENITSSLLSWQSASAAKSALFFFPHSSCLKRLFHRIKVTMATCSCKINPRRWQQFSALQSISTSEHILHTPYYLFNHPSNLAFLEFFYFCHSSVYMYMMREFTRAWIWRSESNMQESVPPLCRFQRSLRSGSLLSKRFY